MNRRHFLKTGTIALFASSFAEKLFASKASHQTTAPFGPVTCENTLPGKTDSKPVYLNASEASNQEDLKVLFLGTGAAGWKSDGKYSTHTLMETIINQKELCFLALKLYISQRHGLTELLKISSQQQQTLVCQYQQSYRSNYTNL